MATSMTFSSALFCFLFIFLISQNMSQPPQINNLLTFCKISHDTARTIQTMDQFSRLSAAIPSSEREPMPTPRRVSALTQPTPCTSTEETSTKEPARSVPGLQLWKSLKAAFINRKLLCSTRNVWFVSRIIHFVGILEESPSITKYSLSNFSVTSSFGQTFSRKMDKLILRAASTTLSLKPYFVEDNERVTEFGTSYVLHSVVQCSPDLDPSNCTVCLRLAVQDILDYCSRSRVAQIFLPKRLVRYATSSFPVNVPSLGVIKGSKIFESSLIAVMTASVLALVGL